MKSSKLSPDLRAKRHDRLMAKRAAYHHAAASHGYISHLGSKTTSKRYDEDGKATHTYAAYPHQSVKQMLRYARMAAAVVMSGGMQRGRG